MQHKKTHQAAPNAEINYYTIRQNMNILRMHAQGYSIPAIAQHFGKTTHDVQYVVETT